MLHVLARKAALDAARAKTHARATLAATACGMGVKDAHHDYNAFQSDMDAIIAAASPADPAVAQAVEKAEIDSYEAIARRAAKTK